jgi:Retrotransposon hot spot protein
LRILFHVIQFAHVEYPQQKDKGDEFVKSIMQDYVDIQGSNGMRVLNGVLDLETHSTRNVVLRDMTEDFWQKVIEATSTHRVCALGTPGIGKTTTTCILIRLLLEQKITVLYRVLGIHNDGFVYMFTPMSKEPIEVDVNVIEEKNFSSWHPEANMTTIYYVVDPGKNLEKNCDLDSNYLGKVIIVASPDSNHWGGTQFWKQRGKSMTGTFLYNPVWRLDELIAAKEHFKYSLNEEEIRNRYEKVGGIPRHIFTDNVTFRGILRDQFFALNKLNKNQLQKMSSNDWDSVHTFDRSQPSSALMVYECPDNSYRKFNVAVASPHVLTDILKRNEMYMWM